MNKSWLPISRGLPEAAERRQILMIGDTTDVNLSTHQATIGLVRSDAATRPRLLVHSVLAVDAKDKQPLSLL